MPVRRRREETEVSADAFTFYEEQNVYADEARKAHKRDPRARKLAICVVIVVVVYIVALLLPDALVWKAMTMQFNANRLMATCIEEVSQNIETIVAVLTGNSDYAHGVGSVKYLVIALAGAGLALSGAVYQGTFRNALVSPSTLGVMTGASFGLMVWVVFFSSASSLALLTGSGGSSSDAGGGMLDYLGTTTGLALVSFAGCLVVVGLVLLVNRVSGGGTSPIIMIITGQMVAGVLGAVSGIVRYYYTYTDPFGAIAELLTGLQIASFYRPYGAFDLAVILGLLGLTFLAVMRLQAKMQVLAFDEGEQRSMGVDTRRTRTIVIALCTLLTAVIVSFCGAVGFVGFLVPHLARRLVGPDFKFLLPASALVGAIFVLGAYTLLDVSFGVDYAQMVGMYISIAGAVVFFVTAVRGKGARLGGFR